MAKPKHDPADVMAKAKAEACEIFKLDPENLTAADELRIGMFATLRLAIDAESARAASASGVDLGKLNTAIQLMTTMLPTALAPPPARRHMTDAEFKEFFDKMVATLVRKANEQAPEDLKKLAEVVSQLGAENAALRAELETLRGTAGDAPAAPSNVTKLRAEPQPEASRAGNPEPPKSAPSPEPRPLDLRAQGAEQKGGSAGFEIRGSSRIIDDGGGFYWGGASGRRSW
jgi:hypothetical protein